MSIPKNKLPLPNDKAKEFIVFTQNLVASARRLSNLLDEFGSKLERDCGLYYLPTNRADAEEIKRLVADFASAIERLKKSLNGGRLR